ncbi:MAG: cytochrome c3 family protein [Chloroflexi bacterium]|nr:cytochrome c3 family protein [Chloroflexota bacterium]
MLTSRLLLRILLPGLALGALASLVVGAFVGWRVLAHYFPALDRPVKAAPQQPIAFPHPVHVQQAGIQCEFCHRNVTKGAAATVPAMEQCMSCHQVIGTGLREVEKLRAYAQQGDPINWVRVHRLPDHVRFVHEPHIRVLGERMGVTPSQVCSTCHGQVETMLRVQQVRPLKMGDCVNCHRANNAPTDCVICHY